MTTASAKNWKPDPIWLAAPALLLLAVFFLLPMFRLLGLSFTDEGQGSISLINYQRLGDSLLYWRILGITLEISALTALFSVLFGYPIAMWLAGLEDRKRGNMLMLVLLPFWTSYLVKTFAWMILLGKNGVFNSILLGSGASERPVNLMYNELGVLIGMVHAMIPLAILSMLPVMSGIDGRLTLAASTMGASRSDRFWLVYFPLSMPGVVAAGLLTFITSLGFFIVPAFLGGRQQTMLAQAIITQVQEIVNWPFAAVLATMLVVAALIVIVGYNKLFGLSSLSSGSGAQGKKAMSSNSLLRKLGYGLLAIIARVFLPLDRVFTPKTNGSPVRTIYVVLVIAFLMLPGLIVIPLSFTSGRNLAFPPPGFSLRWFEQYFNSAIWMSATMRSFGVAFATAFFATVLGGLAALALSRSSSRLNGLIFGLMLAPMIVPRIVIAVGLFYLLAQIGLVATDTGLVIGHTLLALPYAFITIGSVLKNYDWRLNQAAETMGAGKLTVLRLITIPLLRGGLLSAALFAFVTSLDELTIAIFVSGGLKTTLPKQMWDDMFLQLNPTLAAVSVIVLLIVTVILLLARKLER
ncbi:ABC transporter permease subunit [Ochrobactrum sp. Marseille-Q0166]|uniref:ABC transporter permease subunit n=1 Tax=Ochrobactrum sp. Marseille-Q0166 TaxID=2761105 RepID=UPI0016554987|nr:ABC transporter permease subunit [Ochrobactrum sp. Marseille-Q0166]MBC8719610.1 ABC transporter permease subunit [Ochrobactrum sp. Marseille-Q0166]